MVAGSNFAVSVLPFASFPRGGVLESWGFNMTVLLNDSDRDPHEWLNHFESFEAAVLLPESVLREKRRNKRTNMVIVVHRNSQYLKNVKVISPVIDVVVGSKPVYDVDPPLEMVFKVSEMSLREKKAKWGCVSWDETLNNTFGGWSYKGCFSVLVDPTHVRCYCNHLTSFAVILELEERYEAQNSVQPLSLAGVIPPHIPCRDQEDRMGIRLHGGRRTPALLHASFVLLDARRSLPSVSVSREGPRDVHSLHAAESDVICMGYVLGGKLCFLLNLITCGATSSS
ncbi:hypothetical protein AVEN_26978-1 [Araneus ventricosus]|uniref:GAIN-B domain-containing protein n=1 Tax=Araneus ventricosus TaxID=182803 RepID=A0A4Y2SAV4_ARAVE|nr:hypothetical protein AVEN_26978-1 [Araneus ventricosus]